jgi:hypothetical protein
MEEKRHSSQNKVSTEITPPPKVDWNQFLDYINSYDPTKHGGNNPTTIQEDVIYGIGICSNNEFKFADGYRNFKDILVKRWSK